MNIPVPAPLWDLTYAGKNITERISPFVTSVEFASSLEGESDEITLTIEARDGRWIDGWLPQKSDRLQLVIGNRDAARLNCGTFEIDEIEASGPPDTITIRALATSIKPALRTERSAAYEKTTLAGIARKIAVRHGLTIVGTPPAEPIARITQHKETDLAFLRRLSEQYGAVFSVRGDQLIFHDLAALDAAAPIITITRKSLSGDYSLRSKSARIYRAVRVTYWSPKKKKDITATLTINTKIKSQPGDILHLVERCESLAQARTKAKAAIRKMNGRQTDGTLTLMGDIRYIAGVNLTLSGWGQLDNTYQIVKTRHHIDRTAGWSAVVEIGLNGAYGMQGTGGKK